MPPPFCLIALYSLVLLALQTVETLVLHLLFIGTLVFPTLGFRQLSKAYFVSISTYMCCRDWEVFNNVFTSIPVIHKFANLVKLVYIDLPVWLWSVCYVVYMFGYGVCLLPHTLYK